MNPIVIDNGSGSIKAGFAGTEKPDVHFASFVGKPKYEKVMHQEGGALDDDHFVGETATLHRGALNLTYPISHGVVKNWADMQKLWEFTYRELQVEDSGQHPVLLTEAPQNPRDNRGRTAEIFFETFNSPALYFQVQAILSLYASGRVTGLVLDSGDGVTCAVPVYEGFAIANAIQRIDVAGRDVTQYLQKLLKMEGVNLSTSAEFETVKNIKEKLCYVAANVYQADADLREDNENGITYKLPDSNEISIFSEKFQAPELLFDPSIIGVEQDGIHQCIYKAIKKSDTDLRKLLYSNILLAGGSTLFPGLGNRIFSELKKASSRETKITIYSPNKRLTSTWLGGSILAHLATFKKMWVSRKEFEEEGKRRVIYKRCF